MEKLGLEPSDKELTAEYLCAHFGKSRKAVKTCLLDQSVIAGIGNIYADEILSTAGIYPARPANSLAADEWEKLAKVPRNGCAFYLKRTVLHRRNIWRQKGRTTGTLHTCRHTDMKERSARSAGMSRIVVGGREHLLSPVSEKCMMKKGKV